MAEGEAAAWLAAWRTRGEAPALVAGKAGAVGEVWSYARLAAEVERRVELAPPAARPGGVVLVTGGGGPGVVAGLWAAAKLGLVAAPVVDRTPAAQAARQATAGAGWELTEAGEWRAHGGADGSEGSPAPLASRPAWWEHYARTGHAGLLLFTSGTTGRPKGVGHDFDAHLGGWRQRIRAPGVTHRVLVLLRLDQIGGLDTVGRALAGGDAAVLPDTRDPEAVAALIHAAGVDVLPASPSFLQLLLASPAGPGLADSPLRLVPYGSEAMPVGRLARLRAAWPRVTFVPRFGTTETGALRTEPAGAEGEGVRPVDADVAWRIADGELQIRSPRQLLGYLDPTDGADSLTADGWYRTGDLAEELPGGGFRLLGRRVAQINVGGRKVRPEAVEAALVGHPDIVAARVSGRPHALLGEEVVATVEVRPGGPPPTELRASLRAWLAGRLEPHELPTRWEWGTVAVDPETWKVRR